MCVCVCMCVREREIFNNLIWNNKITIAFEDIIVVDTIKVIAPNATISIVLLKKCKA